VNVTDKRAWPEPEITIRPYGDGLRCTPQSVAAHSLYENANPYPHRECSGTFDLQGFIEFSSISF
jgi:hypothetical protein